jgi:dCTP deaminase
MVLSGRDIYHALASGQIVPAPRPQHDRIQGASLDLRPGNSFHLLSNQDTSRIDLWLSRNELRKTVDSVMGEENIPEQESGYLHPGELDLGRTDESVMLPADKYDVLNGRSSLARLRLMVHATMHVMDPGRTGRIVLQFLNWGGLPLGLKPACRSAY